MNCASLASRINLFLDHCRKEDWSGWDPYDGLNSRLFQAVPFFQNKFCRLAFIQFIKACPLNLRPLLRVPPGRNPKGTALFASALLKLSRLGLATVEEARGLIDGLAERRCPGWEHACWGYHFDWQTRGILVPSTMPNIVCTTFVAHALLDMYRATHHAPYLEAAESAGRFITDELASNLPPSAFCIRYFPTTSSTVHNASLLGAALLARLRAFTGEDRFTSFILNAVDFSLRRQRADGSWPYGEAPSQAWVDSFHTGYNLLALSEIGRNVRIPGLPEAIDRGYAFYRRHFFRADGAVRYYHDRTYPVDAHAVGHALLTLAAFSDRDPTALDQASRSVEWAMKHLWSPCGRFYYQYRPWFTNRISYMRWSQAWMMTGLVAVLEREPQGNAGGPT